MVAANCAALVAGMLAAYGLSAAPAAHAQALSTQITSTQIASTQAASRAGTGGWERGMNARARLIAAPGADGILYAGIQIELDNGWKTYWRMPGDSGIPPRFDWSGSDNLAATQVLYPVPRRFADAGGWSVGYAGAVLLPVAITPARPDRPVTLRLILDYAACEKLCVPEQAVLHLAVPAGGADLPQAVPGLEASLAAVPVAADAPGAPARIADIALERDGDGARLIVTAEHRTASTDADLFVEAPGDWYLGLPRELDRQPLDGGALRIRYAVPLSLPADAGKGESGDGSMGAGLRFTITGAGRGAEQVVSLP